MEKVFKVADIRKFEQMVTKGDISYSRMVELMNEMAHTHYVVNKNCNLQNVCGSESSSIRIFKLKCLTEDGDMETNGYYKTREAAELKKDELDKYPMNLKYGIKQQIVEIDLED